MDDPLQTPFDGIRGRLFEIARDLDILRTQLGQSGLKVSARNNIQTARERSQTYNNLERTRSAFVADRYASAGTELPDRLIEHLEDISEGIFELCRDNPDKLRKADWDLVLGAEFFSVRFVKATTFSETPNTLVSCARKITENCMSLRAEADKIPETAEGKTVFNRKGRKANVTETMKGYAEGLDKLPTGSEQRLADARIERHGQLADVFIREEELEYLAQEREAEALREIIAPEVDGTGHEALFAQREHGGHPSKEKPKAEKLQSSFAGREADGKDREKSLITPKPRKEKRDVLQPDLTGFKLR